MGIPLSYTQSYSDLTASWKLSAHNYACAQTFSFPSCEVNLTLNFSEKRREQDRHRIIMLAS